MTGTISTQQRRAKQLITWESATWAEYVQIRDQHEKADTPRVKLFFWDNRLLVDDTGWEGINHSVVRELLLLLLGFWLAQNRKAAVNFMGGCLLEKESTEAASPELALYVGKDRLSWKEGESRKIDLDRWRVPKLVDEISDTTLASDLDEKKKLHASLGVLEYWVVDVRGKQVFFFCLDEQGQYHEIKKSLLLSGLTTPLIA